MGAGVCTTSSTNKSLIVCSKMFDEAADGYGRGEGTAVVCLKRLDAALRDGDSIECIIRETGSNQDGRTKGITMPSAEAQASLIRKTYASARLDLTQPGSRPSFFEAHGKIYSKSLSSLLIQRRHWYVCWRSGRSPSRRGSLFPTRQRIRR